MRWRYLLFLSLLSVACGNTTGHLLPCLGDTEFTARYHTDLQKWGRRDGYSVNVVLASTQRCYSVVGGRVQINGTSVPLGPDWGVGPTYFLRDSVATTHPFRFDGTVERFTVSGGAGFPPMADSLQSFHGTLEVTSPTPFDTIPRNSDLVITWNASQRESDSVGIQVSDPAGYGYSGKHLEYHLPDNGRHVVTASELKRVASGPMIISMERRRFRRSALPDGRPYTMTLQSTVWLVATIR